MLLLDPSRMTVWRPRHGKVDRMLGGACTYIALAASYFNPVKIVAVVGDDFDQADADFLASRGIDLGGLERVPAGRRSSGRAFTRRT